MNYKVSIIIPAYNASKFIERCIDSIISQTYKNIEIIIINDGSTDNTIAVIEQIRKKDDRVVLINQVNTGSNIARKAGYEKSSGKYIYYVDADDYLVPKTIECLLEKAQETNADIILSYHYKCLANKKVLVKNKLPENYNQLILIKELLKGSIKGYLWGKLFKKELLSQIQIPEATPLGDDVITNLKILLTNNAKIALIKEPLYNYVVHGGNITFSTKPNVIEGTYKHLGMVQKILQSTSFNNELCDEHKAYNCRAWIVYNRMDGAKTKDKQYSKIFYKENFTFQAMKYLALYQIFELFFYKYNAKFGRKTTQFIMNLYWKLQ